jgi:hypothetical protein
MTRHELERVILRLMADGRAVTITEIRDVTGCHRDTIGGIVNGSRFERAGQRQAVAHRGGSPSILYRLRRPATLNPLDRPTNPIVDAALDDNRVLADAVRVLVRRGHRDTANQVAHIWRIEDGRLKRIFEGRGIEEEE